MQQIYSERLKGSFALSTQLSAGCRSSHFRLAHVTPHTCAHFSSSGICALSFRGDTIVDVFGISPHFFVQNGNPFLAPNTAHSSILILNI